MCVIAKQSEKDSSISRMGLFFFPFLYCMRRTAAMQSGVRVGKVVVVSSSGPIAREAAIPYRPRGEDVPG